METESAWAAFCRSFCVFGAAGLALIATLNFVVNPLRRYPPRLFPSALWDVRSIKTSLLRARQPKPEILILGSSRSMKIDPVLVERLSGLRAFNASVESAMAEDDYAMLRYAVEDAGIQPRIVLIGIDVEALHDQRKISDNPTPHPELDKYLGLDRSSIGRDAAALLTADQTSYSLQSIRQTLAHDAPSSRTRFDDNGYLHYVKWEAERASGHYDYESKFRKSVGEYQGRFGQYKSVSKPRLRYLKAAIDYCHARHIGVRLFITPLSPRLAEHLRPYGYFDRSREVARDVATLLQPGDGFHDFSDVASFGGSADHFYDGAHMDEQNAALLTERLLALQ